MSLLAYLQSHPTVVRLATIAGVATLLLAVSGDRLVADPLAGPGKLLAIGAAFLMAAAIASYVLAPDRPAWRRRFAISAGFVATRTVLMLALLPAGDQYWVRFVWLVADAAMCVALPGIWMGAGNGTIWKLAALGAGVACIFPFERWVVISACVYAFVLDQHGWTRRHLLGFIAGVGGTLAIDWAARNGWLYDQLDYVFSAALFCFVYALAFIGHDEPVPTPAGPPRRAKTRPGAA